MTCFKRLILVLGVASVSLAIGSMACAEDKDSKKPGTGPNPYTDCGIGAALFPNTHWAAVTSNVIWDLGATAITSATASPQTCSGKKVEVARFIGTSYDELAEETAAGKGEHLHTMLSLFDCKAADQSKTAREIRSLMGQAVASPEYDGLTRIQKFAQYYSIAEQAASHSCSG